MAIFKAADELDRGTFKGFVCFPIAGIIIDMILCALAYLEGDVNVGIGYGIGGMSINAMVLVIVLCEYHGWKEWVRMYRS